MTGVSLNRMNLLSNARVSVSPVALRNPRVQHETIYSSKLGADLEVDDGK